MGFFKLGKIDKGGEKDAKEKDRKKSPVLDESQACGPSVNDFISKTKTRQKQGLKPSGPELIAYARYLGIDPVADHDLLWIAEEALAAPLPSEWTEHFDSSDRVFYYNATTHVSSWTHPLEHLYRETYKTIVHFRGASLSSQEKVDELHKLQQDCHQMEREVHDEITAWTEHTDDQGHRFYFNRVKGKSSWTDPRPAKCHILYLKMKMIRILCQQAGVNFTDMKPGGSRFEPLTPQSGRREDEDRASKRSRTDERDDERKERKERKANRSNSEDRLDGGENGLDLQFGAGVEMDDREGEDDEPRKKKKKKKKKKDKEDLDGEHDMAHLRRSDEDLAQMLHSQSEPSNLGGRGPGGALPPTSEMLGPGGGHELEVGGLQDNRARVKAGIRLEPLDAKVSALPTPLITSFSVPALP
jgi:hypothetical protein